VPDTAAAPDVERAVLAARARALAAPVRAAAEDTSDAVILLDVAGQRYAVASSRVAEVLPPGPTTSLPRGAHELAGARTRRGELLALADPARATGGTELELAPSACFVVVLDGPEPLGLLAEAVTSGRVASALARVAGTTSAVRGLTADGVLVLDPDHLLADPRWRADGRPSPA
jgi:chemotaxis signal transduction protein